MTWNLLRQHAMQTKQILNNTVQLILIMLVCFSTTTLAQQSEQHSSPVITFSSDYRQAIGGYTQYFFEPKGDPVSFDAAMLRFNTPNVYIANSQSISLGIGVAPVWLKFSVENPTQQPLAYRLAIETPWLDYVDAYARQRNGLIQQFYGGDGRAFGREPMPHRFYAHESVFEPGITDIFVRIETSGPMAIPIRLSSVAKAIEADQAAAYQYGILYGIMGALAVYNLLLFSIIRQREYGLYSVYLIGFLLNSLSYTGHIHAMFPTDYGPYFQDWVDAFLMITYSVAGLHFARTLLGTKRYAPRLDRITFNVATYIPAAMLVFAAADQLVITLILAFILNSGFAILFVAMGIAALRANVASAKLFVVSSVTAAICIGISTMAVGGVLPYTDATYKLIEVGMAFEALFLAIILAQRFRLAQRDKLLAEQYARTDSLTGMRNRRGFTENFDTIWHGILRKQRNLSIVLFDVDNFKSINDTYGHNGGDMVLKQLAQIIMATVRKGDFSARWGGEEFVIVLPETDLNEALNQAERLREAIANEPMLVDGTHLTITTSVGVAGSEGAQFAQRPLAQASLDVLLKCADKALYEAKHNGKNQVVTFDPQQHEQSISNSALGMNP